MSVIFFLITLSTIKLVVRMMRALRRRETDYFNSVKKRRVDELCQMRTSGYEGSGSYLHSFQDHGLVPMAPYGGRGSYIRPFQDRPLIPMSPYEGRGGYFDRLMKNGFMSSTQKVLNDTGDRDILSIVIGRTPLASAMTFALNAVSSGSFNKQLKETPADELFHLFMVIETEHGKYVLEKNAVICLRRFTGFPEGSEVMNVEINHGVTLSRALDLTKLRMGDKFYSYKGLDNNCQYFVSSFLKANNFNTLKNIEFVVQETRKLFSNNSKFRKIVNSITDIGAIAENTKDMFYSVVRKPVFGFLKR